MGDGEAYGVRMGGSLEAATATVEQLIAGFGNFLRAHLKAPKTIKEYVRDVRDWAAWWNRDPAEFGPQDYDAWTFQQVEDGYCGVTVRRHQASVRKFFRFLFRKGLVAADPGTGAEAVNIPKRLPVWLEESEVLAMISKARSIRGKAMLQLLYGCGLRNAELRGLRLADVTPDHITVIGKRDKQRVIPIPTAAYAAVQAYLPSRPNFPSPLLFVSFSGYPIGECQVIALIKRCARRAGITKRVTPHVLRHSIATALLNRGLDLRFIQEFLGHDSIESTRIYTHVAKAVLTEKVKACHPMMNTGGRV